VRCFRNAEITGSQNEIKKAIYSEKQRRMEFVIYRGQFPAIRLRAANRTKKMKVQWIAEMISH
jgi:hypothetical protein